MHDLQALHATIPSVEPTLPLSEEQVDEAADFSQDLDASIQHICTLMHAPLLSEKQQEYTLWHYSLGHLSHSKLQELVTLGRLPLKFKNCTPPICPACLFVKQTRRKR
jgi:hypothetical protein